MASYAWNEGVLDLFAGVATTALTAHTPDFGAAWTAGAGFAPKLDGLGGVYQAAAVGDPSGVCLPCALTAALAADQHVELLVHAYDNAGTRDNQPGVIARRTAATTYYYLALSSESSIWELFKVVAGVADQLDGGAIPDIVAGSSFGLALDLVGDQLTTFINGAAQPAVTDAAIGGAGAAGFCLNPYQATTQANGIHVRQFLAGSI